MDVNDLRVVVTLVSMLVFIGIVVWAYSRKNLDSFDEAARLPFDDGDSVARANQGGRS